MSISYFFQFISHNIKNSFVFFFSYFFSCLCTLLVALYFCWATGQLHWRWDRILMKPRYWFMMIRCCFFCHVVRTKMPSYLVSIVFLLPMGNETLLPLSLQLCYFLPSSTSLVHSCSVVSLCLSSICCWMVKYHYKYSPVILGKNKQQDTGT